jgi:hypothetical protein
LPISAAGNDAIDFEIGFLGRAGADANRFVGQLNMQRIDIGFGINREGFDAEFLAGPDHPERDLATIGDEYFVEHRALDSESRFSRRIKRLLGFRHGIVRLKQTRQDRERENLRLRRIQPRVQFGEKRLRGGFGFGGSADVRGGGVRILRRFLKRLPAEDRRFNS